MGVTKLKLEKLLITSSSLLILAFLSLITLPQTLTPTNAANYPHDPVPESVVSISSASASTGINMEAVPNTIATAGDSIEVSTTTVTGYNLKLSTNSTTITTLGHLSLPGYYIPTIASDNTPLTNNTWGYSLTDPEPTSATANFSSVPNNTAAVTLKTTSEATTSQPLGVGNLDPSDTTDVYYGAKVDSSIPSGTYQNTVLYTATSNLVDSPTITSVSPNTGLPVGGTEITITGTNLDSTINITIDGEDCTNIQVLSNIQVTCETPEATGGATGAVDVTIITQGGEVTLTNGYKYANPTYCGTFDYECIVFTVDVGSTGTYSIPTSGVVTGANSTHTYDWDVYIDNELTTDCPNGNCTGTSHTTTAPGVNGIVLAGLTGTHQIKILPHNPPTPGWGNAFGHKDNTTGANATANKNKLISLDAPLTTMAFSPKTSESTTNASYMFAYIFYYCSSLTNAATIIDTYKLPSSYTNLQEFLYSTHEANNNANFTSPVDLSGLSSWLSNNTRISNLSYFLSRTHYWNTNLTTPINLSPISGWFNNNASISSLSSFLSKTHHGNTNLTTPINLSPISGWFSNNTSISSLSDFLHGIHQGNTSLIASVSLAPLTGWFSANSSITNLSYFLTSAHYNNSNVNFTTPIDLSPLTGWFSANNSITNLSNFLGGSSCGDNCGIHQGNTYLSTPIDLSPLSGWFSDNSRINNLSNFLSSIHQGNTSITTPVSLIPIQSWFNSNTSITNLSYFLTGVHSGNTLSASTDLAPLTNWFNNNNSITNLSYFLHGMYQGTTNQLTAPIDLAPLQSWFNSNTSITNLPSFLGGVHYNNTDVSTPVDLIPVENWFSGNNSILDLSGFLSMIHAGANNQLASPINLTPVQGWFSANTSITDLSSFLSTAHRGNTQLTVPIDLTPVQGWFSANNSIINLDNFLGYNTNVGRGLHGDNSNLTTTINLSPLANWFNNNTSITSMNNFLHGTHYNNVKLSAPIDLTPLSNWFAPNRSFANLSGFLHRTHYNNSGLKLNPANSTILPNWVKTATQGVTPIWNTGTNSNASYYSFQETFCFRSTANDTDEVRFQDGTALSSIGQPTVNRETYTGRTGITPLLQNINWQ